MNCIRLGILVLCALLPWIASPAWSGEAASEQSAPTAQIQTGQEDTEQFTRPATDPAASPTIQQPVPQPTTERSPVTPAVAEGVQVLDAVVCQDVVDRAPVGSGDVFTKDIARVFCYCRVIGGNGQSSITHNWYYKGALKASVKLPVRSDNWRTYSSKTITPEWTGEWMVEILSDSGTPLESIIFFIQ